MTAAIQDISVAPYYEDQWVQLYHADLRDRTAWLTADVLITDPPYGMSFVSGQARERRPITGDSDTTIRDYALNAWGDRPAAVFGTWRIPRPAATRQLLVWDKTDGTGPGMGNLPLAFGTSHEEIYLLGAWPRSTLPRRGSVIRTAVAMGGRTGEVARSGHPTPKPAAVMDVLVSYAPPGIIADPFAGSGSTLIAAKTAGRRAIGIEVEERYCEAAAIRLAALG